MPCGREYHRKPSAANHICAADSPLHGGNGKGRRTQWIRRPHCLFEIFAETNIPLDEVFCGGKGQKPLPEPSQTMLLQTFPFQLQSQVNPPPANHVAVIRWNNRYCLMLEFERHITGIAHAALLPTSLLRACVVLLIAVCAECADERLQRLDADQCQFASEVNKTILVCHLAVPVLTD